MTEAMILRKLYNQEQLDYNHTLEIFSPEEIQEGRKTING